MSRRVTLPSSGRCLRSQAASWLPDRRPGDEQEALRGEPRDRQVRLDPAAPVEQLRVDDRADRSIDGIRAHPVEERDGTRAGDLELRERRLVEQTGGRSRGERLGADRGRPVVARPAARAERLVPGRGVRLEPVRPLPAGLLAERRTERLEGLVRRRGAERPPGLALLVGVVDVVVGRVVLDRARERVALRPIRGPEPPDVHLPEVELGFALDDPGRHLASDPARPGDAVGREPRGDEEPADLRFTEDELVVGREPLGAVDDPADARVLHRRHPPDRALHDRLEPRHVGREQLPVEVRRDAIEPPRRRVVLVAAHAQPADLLAEVDEVVRVAQLRQARVDALDRLGEQVLVRHRDDRAR